MQSTSARASTPGAGWGMGLSLLAVAAVPVSLLWDFSWESTIGVDVFWSPPHLLTHTAMALALVGAVTLMRRVSSRFDALPGVTSLGPVGMPLGGWLLLWGALTFLTALLFDRWWQGAYGLQAGIWHPPQVLKAVAFFTTAGGVWLVAAAAQNEPNANPMVAPAWFCVAGGCVLALITIVTLTASYPNQQHSASFYLTAGATYPLVLAALARGGRLRWSATWAALVYTMLVAGMVWLLPRFEAKPLTGPIYNPLEHLMPPPFPLLLLVPALAMDCVVNKVRWPEWRGLGWLRAGTLGLAFFIPFLAVQWNFAEFLLTPRADNWFFSGGGRHWPFFLKISPPAQVAFWSSPEDLLNWSRALLTAAYSTLAACIGHVFGVWLARVRR